MCDVKGAIERVRQAGEGKGRAVAAEKMATVVKDCSAVAATGDTIDQLADLLTHREDIVRYWAATALGYIGPKAESAIPALERAYEEKKNSSQSKTSASAIRVALERIRHQEKSRSERREP
jgi:hypothetical protein